MTYKKIPITVYEKVLEDTSSLSLLGAQLIVWGKNLNRVHPTTELTNINGTLYARYTINDDKDKWSF